MFSTITGHLITVGMDGEEPTPDGFEGIIQIQAELPKESTLYRIGVPRGLMDTVMPSMWGLRVNALVGGQNGYPFYTLFEIEEADSEDEEGCKAGYDEPEDDKPEDYKPEDDKPEDPAVEDHQLAETEEKETAQSILKALAEALTAKLGNEVPTRRHVRVLWPNEMMEQGDPELIEAVRSERWCMAQNPILITRPDEPELADYRITRLTKQIYLAEMYPATRNHAEMTVEVGCEATAAMMVTDPTAFGDPYKDSGGDAQANLDQLTDHLDELMNFPAKYGGQTLVLWHSGWDDNPWVRDRMDKNLSVGCVHANDNQHFSLNMPDTHQQAQALQVRPGLWLATVYEVQVDLKERKLVRGKEPAGQLLVRIPIEQSPAQTP